MYVFIYVLTLLVLLIVKVYICNICFALFTFLTFNENLKAWRAYLFYIKKIIGGPPFAEGDWSPAPLPVS